VLERNSIPKFTYKDLETVTKKKAQQGETIEHSPISTQLPKQISHSLERIVSVQPRDSMAVLQKPPTQADVLMNESVLEGPSFESGEKEASLGESNAEALVGNHRSNSDICAA